MKARLLVLCAFVFMIVPASWAKTKPAPTAPGTYKDWGPDIDQIEILQTFKTTDYDKIVVIPFDTSKAPLPDQKEKWYGTMKSALEASTTWFMEKFPGELKLKTTVEENAKPGKTPKMMIIRGSVDKMDPGSRAGRYFGGFGAGSASATMTTEFIDAKTGKVLARVTQGRRSGGTFKGGGGSDLDVMRDSIHAIAEDNARVLNQFQ